MTNFYSCIPPLYPELISNQSSEYVCMVDSDSIWCGCDNKQTNINHQRSSLLMKLTWVTRYLHEMYITECVRCMWVDRNVRSEASIWRVRPQDRDVISCEALFYALDYEERNAASIESSCSLSM